MHCVNTPTQRPSPLTSVFNANAPTFARYLAPFRSQTDPLPEPPQPWSRTEANSRPMASTTTASTVAERSYGLLKSRAKVAKGIQTDDAAPANRKRCWRHRRGSSDKSRRSSGSENEQGRQEANSNNSSPNGTAMSVLRNTLLPNVSFPRWTRAAKVRFNFYFRKITITIVTISLNSRLDNTTSGLVVSAIVYRTKRPQMKSRAHRFSLSKG